MADHRLLPLLIATIALCSPLAGNARDKHALVQKLLEVSDVSNQIKAGALAATAPIMDHIRKSDEAAEITPAGTRFLADFGVDLSALSSTRRHFCRLCLDWTERRPHIAGAVGAALTKRYFDLGWTERIKDSRAVIITAVGKRGFSETFGIDEAEVKDAVG